MSDHPQEVTHHHRVTAAIKRVHSAHAKLLESHRAAADAAAKERADIAATLPKVEGTTD